MDTTHQSNTTISTKTLADSINEQHALAFGKASEALEHARQAGVLLIEAKAAVKHGEWLPWFAAHVEFSVTTAQGYMRLAKRWGELTKNATAVAHLTLREALDCLAEPKAPPEFRWPKLPAGMPEPSMDIWIMGKAGDKTICVFPGVDGFYWVSMFEDPRNSGGILEWMRKPVKPEAIGAVMAKMNFSERDAACASWETYVSGAPFLVNPLNCEWSRE